MGENKRKGHFAFNRKIRRIAVETSFRSEDAW